MTSTAPRVVLVHSPPHCKIVSQLKVNKQRDRVLMALLEVRGEEAAAEQLLQKLTCCQNLQACGIFPHLHIQTPFGASEEQMGEYHSVPYLRALQQASAGTELSVSSNSRQHTV